MCETCAVVARAEVYARWPRYQARDDSGTTEALLDAETNAEAIEAANEWLEDGDWRRDGSTYTVNASVERWAEEQDRWERVGHASYIVEPDPPACLEDSMPDMLRYRGGMFELEIDAHVYYRRMDGGADEEAGSLVDGDLWAGLLRGHLAPPPGDDHDLTADEVAFLDRQAGCILTEDSHRFVTVTYYTDPAALKLDWADQIADLDKREL